MMRNMKEAYYYLRRKEVVKGKTHIHRCGVVYLMKGEKGRVTARGVSICNRVDNFERSIGIAKARGLAVKAIKHCNSSGRIRRVPALDKVERLEEDKAVIMYKSEIEPLFSKFELEILGEKNAKV